MKELKISEFADVVTGGTPSTSVKEYWENGKIPWLNSGELNKGYIYNAENFITEAGLKNSSTKMMPANTVLIALTGATCGLSAITKIEACANQSVTGILPSNNHIPEYLFHYLRTQRQRILDKAWGNAQPHISQAFVKDFKVPLPPLPDQLHIANLLSKAENLIAQRKESIRLLDEFLKSTFLEMFGDPVRNEKGWDVTSLSEFGSLKNGLNYTKSESGVNVRCLGVGDFKEYSKLTDMESLQILSLTSEPNKEYFLKDGDLVFVRSNGNRELVGRCLLVFPKSNKVTFSGFCIRYRIEKNGLNPVLISHLFRVPTFRNSMLSGGKGANIQNISQQTLEKLKIPIPPIELQTQFAKIVEKTESLKTQYQQSLQELENLYGSLSQKAFRRELSISKNQKAVEI